MGHFNNKDLVKKEYLAIIREMDELRMKEWDLGYTDLEVPIRHGWFLETQFNPKLEGIKKYREIYHFLKERSEKSNYWGRTKKEAREKFDSANSLYGTSNRSLVLDQKEFNRLTDSSQTLCVHFTVKFFVPYTNRYKNEHLYRVKLSPKYCKLRYIKCYITKRKNIDPNITSRLQELDNLLLSSKFYSSSWYAGGRWKDWDEYDYKKKRRKLKQTLGDLLNNPNP